MHIGCGFAVWVSYICRNWNRENKAALHGGRKWISIRTNKLGFCCLMVEIMSITPQQVFYWFFKDACMHARIFVNDMLACMTSYRFESSGYFANLSVGNQVQSNRPWLEWPTNSWLVLKEPKSKTQILCHITNQTKSISITNAWPPKLLINSS